MPAPSTRVNTGRRPAAPASRYRPGLRTRHAAQPALAPAAERETASQHARRTCRVRFGVTAVLALAWSSPRSLRRSGCQSSSSIYVADSAATASAQAARTRLDIPLPAGQVLVQHRADCGCGPGVPAVPGCPADQAVHDGALLLGWVAFPPRQVKPYHSIPPTNSAPSRPMPSLLIAVAASRHLGMRASSSACGHSQARATDGSRETETRRARSAVRYWNDPPSALR